MFTRILVAIDGSHTSRRALDLALSVAKDNHAALMPVYVVSAPVLYADLVMYDSSATRSAMIEEGQRVSAEAAQLMAAGGIRGEPHVTETDGVEDVAHRILGVADELGVDLLIMGTHGRHGVGRLLLGSVAERVLRQSTRPVLLVPGIGAAMGTPASATEVAIGVAPTSPVIA